MLARHHQDDMTFCWDRESQATKTGSCKRFGVDPVQHKKLIEIIYAPSRKLTSPLPAGTCEDDLPFAQVKYVSYIRKNPSTLNCIFSSNQIF